MSDVSIICYVLFLAFARFEGDATVQAVEFPIEKPHAVDPVSFHLFVSAADSARRRIHLHHRHGVSIVVLLRKLYSCVLGHDVLPEGFPRHDQDLVLSCGQLSLDLGIVDYVVSRETLSNIILSNPHGVVVVPEVAGRLEVLVAVQLHVSAGDVGVGPHLVLRRFSEELLAGVVVSVEEGVEAHTDCSVGSKPGEGVAVEGGPHLQPVEVHRHGDVLGADAVVHPAGEYRLAFIVDEHLVGGIRVGALLIPRQFLAYSAVRIGCFVIVQGFVIA
jgi:hypothetical protein